MDGWNNTNKKDKEYKYSIALSRLEDVLWFFFSVYLIDKWSFESFKVSQAKNCSNFPLEFL